MDKESLLTFPQNFPYDMNTEDEDIIAGITRRFSHFTSIHQPLFTFKEKNTFSSSLENNIRWSSFNHTQSPLPLTNGDEDDWDLIYATAASEVARMKLSNFPAEEYFWQREYSGGSGRRVCVWGPPQVGGGMVAKRECAGTGVFLPRGYCVNNNNHPLPESRKRQACSPANLPPRMMNQSTNKTSVPVNSRPEIPAHIDVGFIPNYEMLMSRRNALILAAQQQHRSNMHRGVMESPMNNNINPEVLLPQEWTY